jgi:hypothetical protein
MAKFLLKDLKNQKTQSFSTIEDAREYVKKIYAFEDRSSVIHQHQFTEHFYIAQLFQSDTKEHIELYMGKGTEDFRNKIIIKVRDQFDLQTGNTHWRTLTTISL